MIWGVAGDKWLRNLALTLAIGNSHMLMDGPQVPLARDKKNALSGGNFPQAPQGRETLIQMPDLGKGFMGGRADDILHFLSLTIWACSPHGAPKREGPDVILFSHYTIPF